MTSNGPATHGRPARLRVLATTTLGALVLGTLIAACGTAPADPGAACDRAVARAVAIDPHSDTVQSVDGAIAGCGSLEAWVKAAQRYPDAFGGKDPAAVARDRCATSTALAGAAVCAGLQGH